MNWVQFERFFSKVTRFTDVARRFKNVCVPVQLTAISIRRMQCQVNGDTISVRQFACKRFGQREALFSIQFCGKSNDNLTCQNCIAPFMVCLDAIPKCGTVGDFCTPRQK